MFAISVYIDHRAMKYCIRRHKMLEAKQSLQLGIQARPRVNRQPVGASMLTYLSQSLD